jgi:hypothetical protein
MQSAKSGVSRVLGLPAKLIYMPEAYIRGCYVLTVTLIDLFRELLFIREISLLEDLILLET